ncbi:hypothetical protein [Burkholderia ubonensis]|uniref:DUF1488 family protein n=1 Tax=Burkholderia ubonensis subsp. mesacidophila TaxID=265293 RepID=A0A2A4FC24_9BURK|nr:hypothetical protein [Burkholderia ubonensis]PCE30168.1 hypothetical protein BZL54_22215 [Burkholderia ubonensis subsp. mesacidophila]
MKNLVRAEMETSNPKRAIITYDVGGRQIETCTISRDAVEQLRRDAFVMPRTLADFGGALDDEFARKLGRAALLLLATAQPELETHIAVTKDQ